MLESKAMDTKLITFYLNFFPYSTNPPHLSLLVNL